MSINNIQAFSGDVEMLSGNVFAKRLFVEDAITELGSNNQSYDHVGLLLTRQAGEYANIAIFYDDTAGQDTLKIGYTTNVGTDDTITLASSNLVTNIAGNIEAQFFIGNGSQLEGLVTDLQSVTDGGNSTSNNLLLTSEGTAINVSAGNVFVNNYITASRFYGDGAYLTNIAANFEEIIINGNVTNNVVELRNATSLVTTGSVGISNLQPNENFDLSIGSNIYFDDDAADGQVMRVEGNVNVHSIYFQTLEIEPTTYGLEQVAAVSNDLPQTIEFSNVTTAFVTDRKIGIGTEPDTDVGLSGAHVYGHLRLGGASGLQDNDQLKIMSTGGLTVAANDADGQYDYSNLILRAGDSNSSQIFVCGAYTDADRQKIVFQTKNTDRMTILSDGVVNVASNVEASFFIGNGSALTGLVTDLQSVSEGGNTTDQTIIFENPDVSINAYGNVEAQFFIGNGSQLEGLVTDLQSVTEGGNTTNQSIVFSNVDMGANISTNLFVGDTIFVDDVTLSAAPTYNLQQVTGYGASTNEDIYLQSTTASTSRSTGALRVAGGVGVLGNVYATNVYTNVYSEFSNISHLVTGNLETPQLTVNAVAVQMTLGLEQVCNSDNELLNNTMVISNLTPATSATTGALTVSGGVGVSGNLFVGSMPVAQTASNLVTWDSTTKQFNDSGGLFSNKLAVVSQQPVEALTGGSTTVTDHGTYVASASSGTAHDAFDRDDFSYWLSSTGYTGTSNAYVGATQLATGLPVGEWLRVKMPYKVTVRHLVFTEGYNGASLPLEANVYATNDEGQSWTLVKELTNITAVTPHVVDATASYAEYALVVTKVAGNYDKTSIAEWKLFCESFTVKDGLINMSKIGNIENSLTVTRGEALQSYPPGAMTDTRVLFEGHGVYSVSASNNNNYLVRRAFLHSPVASYGGGSIWYQPAVATYSATAPYDALSTAPATVAGGTTYRGEWLQMDGPEKIFVKKMGISPRAESDDVLSPDTGVILGSNDEGNTFEYIDSWTISSYTDNTYSYVPIASTTAYKTLRVVFTSINGNNLAVNIGNMTFLGTPEPTVIDDGVMNLKTLNVQNIGSKTPVFGSLHLALEMSTKYDFDYETYDLAVSDRYDNDSLSGTTYAIQDTAGRNVSTAFVGEESNVYINYTEDAFTFDGVGDYLQGHFRGMLANNAAHSFSVWFKTRVSATEQDIFIVSNSDVSNVQYNTDSSNLYTAIRLTTSDKLVWYHWENDITYNATITPNTWYHVCCTYGGGATPTYKKLYLNGVEITDVTTSGSQYGTELKLGNYVQRFEIGGGEYRLLGQGDKHFFNGHIADIKFWSANLNAAQVSQLYALGRNYLENTNVASSLSIGRGGRRPRAALDVHGPVVFDGPVDMTGPVYNPGYNAMTHMNGGGVVTWGSWSNYYETGATNYCFKWTSRLIPIGYNVYTGAYYQYINIEMPAEGTKIPYLYNGRRLYKTVTSIGIPLLAWDALYYVMDTHVTANRLNHRFVIRYHTQKTKVPSTWLLLAAINGDSGTGRTYSCKIPGLNTQIPLDGMCISGSLLMYSTYVFGSPYDVQLMGLPVDNWYWYRGATQWTPRQMLTIEDPGVLSGVYWAVGFESETRGTAYTNHLGLNIPFEWMMVYEVDNPSNIMRGGFANGYLAFNQRSQTQTTDKSGTGFTTGYRIYLGYAGGMGFYRTDQDVCSWNQSTGAVGAGYDGATCGSFPNNLVWGTGNTANSATYLNITTGSRWRVALFWTNNVVN